MPQEEQTGFRNGAYSAWHRTNSIARFLPGDVTLSLAMIDVDIVLFVEYDDVTKIPIMLIETSVDKGQSIKPATVTLELARMAGILAFCVLYELSDAQNPFDATCKDIKKFRVRQLFPSLKNEFTILSPQEWAEWLVRLRKRYTHSNRIE